MQRWLGRRASRRRGPSGADATHRPAFVTGFGEHLTLQDADLRPRPDPHARRSRRRTRRSPWPACPGPTVDTLQLYDCYTITVLLTLEDAGFCGKGEGIGFVMPTTSPMPATSP